LVLLLRVEDRVEDLFMGFTLLAIEMDLILEWGSAGRLRWRDVRELSLHVSNGADLLDATE